MSKDTFLRGAMILTMAGIVVKMIGAVNRILLSRLLGGEGIGLYQMAYPIYLLALSISSAGIPVAISIIVAEKIARRDYFGASRVFRLSLLFLAFMGVLFTLLLYYGASWLVDNQFVRDPRAYYAIAALAPAIFFVTVLSSYRGYFQGLQMMTPTAVSQIFEQLIRVIVMIALAVVLLPKGLEYAAAGATFGAAPGAVAGLLVLLYFYFKQRNWRRQQLENQAPVKQESALQILTRIIRLALPVSLANIMLPIVSSIDLLVVPARLEVAGYAVSKATELFGYLTGMAVALINLPTILTASLATGLVPAISEAHTVGDKARIYQRTAQAMRITFLITIPAFIGMGLLATPISQMLYGTPNAGICIAILSLGIVLLGVHQVSTGVLQGLGYTAIPLINMVISAAVKVGMSWHLTAIPQFGIMGAAWASNADFGLAAMLNMYFVHKHVGFRINMKETMKPILASIAMGLAVWGSFQGAMALLHHNTLATLAAITAGAAVYAVVILLIGGITGRDIEMIPRVGPKIASHMRSWRLLK